MTRLPYEATPEAAARIVGEHVGVSHREGGWLYGSGPRPVCQGWASYADLLQRRGVIVSRELAGVTRWLIDWTRVR